MKLKFLLAVFLILSFVIFAVKADGLIPTPIVKTEQHDSGYGMTIQQGNLQEAFGIGKSYNAPTESMMTIWQGNIFSNESDTWYDFQYQLFSYGDNASQIFFNCSGETIPAMFLNCGSFDMATTSVTRDSNNVPIWTNTVDLNNIPVATYGHTSMINIVLKQHFHADWTTLTIKTDVFADLTNLKLYTSKDNEVPQGTTYSLNFYYSISLWSSHHTNDSSVLILPSQVTPTEVVFRSGQSHSVADMSLADNYAEMQGTNQVPKMAGAFFQSQQQGCTCNQIFNGLTYGLTTGIQSDPTIHIQHPRLSAMTQGLTFPILPVAIGITIGGVVTAVVVRYIKKKRSKKE
jgi:hypothetical protein